MSAWAQSPPDDVVTTAASELAGTSASATYGPPYNRASEGQKIGPIPLQKLGGVRLPVNSADLVLGPLGQCQRSETHRCTRSMEGGDPDQRTKWASDYADAIGARPETTSLPPAPAVRRRR